MQKFIIFLLSLVSITHSSVIIHKKNAVVWSRDQLITGETTAFDAQQGELFVNDTAHPFEIDAVDNSFAVPVTIGEGTSEIYAVVDSSGAPVCSDTIRLTLGFDVLPEVYTFATVANRTVTLHAKTIKNPEHVDLDYFWHQDVNNPQSLGLASIKDSLLTFTIPNGAPGGEYYFDLLAQFCCQYASGKIINDQQTRVLFNSHAGIQALSLWKNIYHDVHMETFSLSHDIGFISQKCAMVLDGPWNLPRYRRINNFDWAVVPLPAGPEGKATYIAGEHLAIFKQNRHPQQAWTFVKWVLSPDVQTRFSIQSGYLPVRPSVLDRDSYKKYLQTDTALAAFIDQLDHARERQSVDHFRVEINQAIAEAIEKAILGDVDVKTALDEAARTSNFLLDSIK